MKANEFVDQSYFAELYERLYSDSIISESSFNLIKDDLFEDKGHLDRVKAFVHTHKQSSEVPVIGRAYAPIAITMVGPLKILIIEYSADTMHLTQIGKNYSFTINNQTVIFPNNAHTTTSIADTFLYRTTDEAYNLITLAMLSLSEIGWTTQKYMVDQNGIKTRTT